MDNTKKTNPKASETKRGAKPGREIKDEKENSYLYREIAGVCIVLAGILLGVFCYSSSKGLLAGIIPFLFGVFGLGTYILPIVLATVGILLIALPKNRVNSSTVVCISIILVAFLAIIHTASSAIEGQSFFDVCKYAYLRGKLSHGGGVLGGIISFCFVSIIGTVGSYIALGGIILIMVMIITRLSLRDAGERAGTGVVHAVAKARERSRESKLYISSIDDVDDDENTYHRVRRIKKKNKVNQDELDLFVENTDTLAVSRSSRKRCHGHSIRSVLGLGASDRERQLEFFPINDRGQESYGASLDGDFNIRINQPQNDSVNDSYDPDEWEQVEIVPDAPASITDYSLESFGTEAADCGSSPYAKDPPCEARQKQNTSNRAAEAAADKSGADDSANPPPSEGMPADLQIYQRPPFNLLNLPDPAAAIASESPSEKAKILIETLNSFNISARIINITIGPAITRFELQPAQGIRVNRITTLSNDIALALAAQRVRIEAPIPGKAAIGIEIPNKDTAPVLLREVLETKEFGSAKSPLTFALGKDIAGKVVLADLERMPHMLIAGQTGSGKSVCINGIILSMVYKSAPKDVRMILIDPKVVELNVFSSLPHLFCPVVTDPKKAAGALKWAVNEMSQRYLRMGKINARDIYRYNSLQEKDEDKWPRLVIVIDELADLMMVASKDVEESICRIAQLGRACGIHLVVATQRPSVDVITGLIKANIPSRIAFAVSNATDSRVILDSSGAEKLLGRGDMLFHPNGASKPIRAQGAYVGDEEVESVMAFFDEHRLSSVSYDETVISEITSINAPAAQGNGKQEDELLPEAVRIVMESGSASISMIQRRLRVGYARAARLVDIMEQKKIVSGFDGSKPRKVLIDAAGYQQLFGASLHYAEDENNGETIYDE